MPRLIERPIGTITTRDRWAVVNGDQMRMLQVSEAEATMGFPANYLLLSSRREATFMLGNAVFPPAASGILRAPQGRV